MPSLLSTPFLLSSTGSDRATAYSCSNKAIEYNGQTFVVWAETRPYDADRLCTEVWGRIFDQTAQSWGESRRLGVGSDNHTNPSLSLDHEGILHLAYGPHGHKKFPDEWPSGKFKYARSSGPGTLDGLQEPASSFGYNGTYACLTHAPDGEGGSYACIAYRGGEAPPSLMFQRGLPENGWSTALQVMAQDIPPGYTFYGAQVAADSRGTLYIAGAFYSMHVGTSAGVVVLRSTDGGLRWRGLNGDEVRLPLHYSVQFAAPHTDPAYDPRLWSLQVDGGDNLWILTGPVQTKQGDTFSAPSTRAALLSRYTSAGWQTIDISSHLSKAYPERFAIDGSLCIDTRGRLHVAVCANDKTALSHPDYSDWGHPSREIFYMVSSDGGENFEVEQVTRSRFGSWLPLFSRPTPFHPVQRPALIWTHGETNVTPGCQTATQTEVFCAFARD